MSLSENNEKESAKQKRVPKTTTHEQTKAKMRAYYHAHKDQWKKYNRDQLARMNDDEKAEFEKRQREYGRAYYAAHRKRVIERTSQYQRDHKEQFVTYRAAWFQSNKEEIAARRRKHYHKVVKPRQQKAKANCDLVTISQAVEILGAKLRPFREWVYQGRIRSIKTPGGRYLLRRADVEDIRSNIHHYPLKIRITLGLTKKGSEA